MSDKQATGRYTVVKTKAATKPWVLCDYGVPLMAFKSETVAQIKADVLNRREEISQ